MQRKWLGRRTVPNISLSTGWQPEDRLQATFSQIIASGLTRIELHRMGSAEDIADVLSFCHDHGVVIGSLHAVLEPWRTERANCAGDFLVSADLAKRQVARDLFERSVAFCQEHEIPVLVMHVGALESEEIRQQDAGSMSSGMRIPAEVIRRREELGKTGLEEIVTTLEQLLSSSDDVKLAIEGRNRLAYFPTPAELGQILSLTSPKRVGYWHDMAHARAYERLVGFPRPDWFAIAGQRAWGNHVQDSTVRFREHMPLGAGDDEFTRETLGDVDDWVLEISQEHSSQAVADSVERLRAPLGQ